MMRTSVALLAVVWGLTVFAADDTAKTAAVAKEWKGLEGTWKVVSIVQSGKELPETSLGETMTIKDGKVTQRGTDEDDKDEVVSVRLDPSCDPKVIDFDESGKDFKNTDDVIEGVYVLDGDTLKICINVESGEPAKANRPTAIESKEGSATRLVIMKREKK